MFDVVCISKSYPSLEIGQTYRCYSVTQQVGADENGNTKLFPAFVLQVEQEGTVGWAVYPANAFLAEQYAKPRDEWPKLEKYEVWEYMHECGDCKKKVAYLFHKIDGQACTCGGTINLTEAKRIQ